MLRYINALPRFLLGLPAGIRLGIVVLCTIGVEFLYCLLAPVEQNPSLLVIPIIVSSWIYRRVGALLSGVAVTGLTWIFYAFFAKTLLLPHSMTLNFLAGVLALVVIAILTCLQRGSFERTAASERELARAYEHEQRANRAKDHFIRNVNHELRTPLTALSACVELLLSQNEHFDQETRASFLENAMLSCEELELLINNILDSLQIGSNDTPITLRSINLPALIYETVRLVDPHWGLQERVRLEMPPNLPVRSHPQYLRQILRNLLSNAAKYAPGAQPIVISARPLDDAPDCPPEVCISIKDQGPGIPASEIEQIFDPFVRLERDALGQVRGTGLGLSITKQLVEGMNGRIWVESSGIAGEGSCFSFTLPMAASGQLSYVTPQRTYQQLVPITQVSTGARGQ